VADPTSALATVLSNSDARQKHLQTLAAFVLSGGYDGVALNYAGVTPELGPSFAQFVADLAAELHGQNKSLLVQVPPPTKTNESFEAGGYDGRALGAAADALLIPVADDPTAFGGGLADAELAWAIGTAPRAHLRLLTSADSVKSAGGEFSLIGQAAAL